jgi:hypothetical protein
MANKKDIGAFFAVVGGLIKAYQIYAGHDMFCNCPTCAPANAATVGGFILSLL